MRNILIKTFAVSLIIIIASCFNSKNAEIIEINNTKLPFKEFLKSQKLSVDIEMSNEFETIQKGNKYANHYFGVATILPNSWKIDRGVSQFTLIRAFQEQESSSITLIAIPIEVSDGLRSEELQQQFKKSPLRTMNSISNGNFRDKLFNETSASTNTEILNFKLGEEFISTTNYLKWEYEFVERSDEYSFDFKTVGYQVILWGVNYTISYTAPKIYFNESLIKQSLLNTSFIKKK